MDADVEKLCDQLTLIELEQEEIHVECSSWEEVLTKGSHYLIAKLHTNRPYNHDEFKNTMKKVWRPTKPIKFHELGDGDVAD